MKNKPREPTFIGSSRGSLIGYPFFTFSSSPAMQRWLEGFISFIGSLFISLARTLYLSRWLSRWLSCWLSHYLSYCLFFLIFRNHIYFKGLLTIA